MKHRIGRSRLRNGHGLCAQGKGKLAPHWQQVNARLMHIATIMQGILHMALKRSPAGEEDALDSGEGHNALSEVLGAAEQQHT
jgi:hypothetical protein